MALNDIIEDELIAASQEQRRIMCGANYSGTERRDKTQTK